MATIDDIVAGLVAFRNEVYTRLDIVQASLDTLTDPTKKVRVWFDCPKCHGDGIVLDFASENGVDNLDVVVPPGVLTPAEKQCPRCHGTKRITWGWINQQGEVAP